MSNQFENLTAAEPGIDFNIELFFQLSQDMLCIAGFDGYFKKINPMVSKTLGYTNEELFSRPINDFVYQDDKDITANKRDGLRKSAPLLNFENRYVTKSGEIVWLSWTSIPVESLKVVFAIAKNITHKKKLEEDRNYQLTRLTRINAELKQLTYTTSHDLRSPVSNLITAFGLIDTSKIQDEETLEYIEILRTSSESLQKTLNQHMDSLIRKDYLKVPVEEIDMQDCLAGVLESIKSLIKSSGALIDADFSALETIVFNRVYLESIFLNLVTNAIKYAKTGFRPEIKIRSCLEDGRGQLIVSDRGLGIDLEKFGDRLFGFNQKFHTHDDSKGIGLYLVYNHVTSLGGHIDVESSLGEGTRFIISFSRQAL
jgi:PAS domain S-box-containing protein